MDRFVKRRKTGSVAEVSTAAVDTARATGVEAKAAGSGGLVLKAGELMHSTSAKSVAKRAWLARATDLERVGGRAYCSTDGSSTGWHACVFVGADSASARLVARWRDCGGSRNVGAEGFGFALGVATLPRDCANCVFLADFLNALAFDVGAAKYKHAALVEAYDEVKAERAARTVDGGTLDWAHVHHPGHQTDASWYTVLNCCADNLAGRRRDIDIIVPTDLLPELAAQPPATKLKAPRADVLAAFLGPGNPSDPPAGAMAGACAGASEDPS